MSDISLSKAVRSNLLSLQNTASMMAKTQERLATGNKVNSALDNPTNFFTASSLNSRAGDINQLLDGMANGIQTIKAADNGLSAITKTLESMQSTLRQARQDKSFQTQSLDMTTFSASTSLDGTEQLSFSGGSVGSEFSIDLTKAASVTDPAVAANTAYGAEFTMPDAASRATLISTLDATTLVGTLNGATAGTETLVVNDGTADRTLTINTGTGSYADADALVGAINTQLTAATADVEAYLDGGNLAFRSTTAGETTGVAITTGSASIAANTFAATQGEAEGTVSFSVQGPGDTAATPVSLTRTQISAAAGATDSAKLANAINTALGSSRSVSAQAGTGTDAGTLRFVATTAGDGTIAVTGADNALFGAATAGSDEVVNPNGFAAKSVEELVNEINRKVDDDGNANPLYGNIRASNDNGKLRIQNLSTTDLTMQGVSTNGVVDGTSGTDVTIDGNAVRTDLSNQYRELRDQLDKLADDASFNGINLLRGDNLQITFNETSTSELNIRSKDEQGISSSILGLETDLQASDLDSDANIDTLIADVKTAINTVRSQSSAFGSSLSIVQNRQDFSKNMINTLQTGAANLTLADMNEEAANLLALQTRQSLSSSALSMASQADQSVLQLLR